MVAIVLKGLYKRSHTTTVKPTGTCIKCGRDVMQGAFDSYSQVKLKFPAFLHHGLKHVVHGEYICHKEVQYQWCG